jgi:hypothetical protein
MAADGYNSKLNLYEPDKGDALLWTKEKVKWVRR